LCDRSEGNALLAESINLIGDKSKPAHIAITLSPHGKGKSIEVDTILKHTENRDEVVEHTNEDIASPFACAYGVGRLFDGPVDPGYRYANSTFTLFRYDSNLIYPELVVRRLKDFMGEKTYSRTMTGIANAIGLANGEEIDVEKGGGVIIRSKSLGNVGIRSWADGHRVPFNLIMDVYSWAMQAGAVAKNGMIRGILLIDEIGQLLHPSLELNVIQRVRNLFGQMQLFLTSQSPMVALGAQLGELVSLKEQGKHVVKEESLPDLSGYSVEDIVADSNLFDAQVYSPETNKQLSRYRALVAKPNLNHKLRAELKELADSLLAHQIPGVQVGPTSIKLDQLLKKHNL
jgi:hypothetical protein